MNATLLMLAAALQLPKVTPTLRNDVVGAWVFEKTSGPVGDDRLSEVGDSRRLRL